eukprot:Protomagalhaensia_wolfi_Nauph_80__4160@NODE_4229_length_610_cov_81_975482_g3362_i0_p1_GENE_NODE_4229_length_610_cov_81_975482_g3362_i0NODE_4229_length_610_cov_81_975482_g3362_i0_p1_ORF_typecomplete_len103_score15_71LSM/PF01423_22/2e13SMATX/PF14438_6/0_025Hfq/PF17209_3/0_15_NODE_4229_length_610_cov_81_975482_g3362_i047355
MTTLLSSLVDHFVGVITVDGRLFQGKLVGFDQSTNIVLESCEEKIVTDDEGFTTMRLGVYLIRGDTVALAGDMNLDAPESRILGKLTEPMRLHPPSVVACKR